MSTAQSTPDVGGQIRKAREFAGFSQVGLADALNVAERTVQAWEGNTRTPRLEALTQVAALLGQSTAFFYGHDDIPVAA